MLKPLVSPRTNDHHLLPVSESRFTLSLVETKSRRVVSVHVTATREEALELYRKAGAGLDAFIDCAEYYECILKLDPLTRTERSERQSGELATRL